MDIQPGIAFGIIAMLGWGISDFIAAYVSRKATPLKAFALARVFSSVCFLALFVFFFTPVSLSAISILTVMITALLYVLAAVSFYKGLSIGKISIISPVASSYPVFTVVLSVLFLGENLTGIQMAAIALAISGSILTAFRFEDMAKLNFRLVAKGLKYSIFASLCWGLMFLLIGILSSTMGWYLPALLINLLGSFYVFSYAKLYKKDLSFPARRITLLILLLGLLEVVSLLSYTFGTTVSYTAIVVTVSSVYPAITVLLAWFFFKERLDANQWLGIALILLGIAALSF